jgi:hypothetical protein
MPLYKSLILLILLLVSSSSILPFKYAFFFVPDLQEVGGGRGDWMELAQDRERWRALVGTVRDFRVLYLRGIS